MYMYMYWLLNYGQAYTYTCMYLYIVTLLLKFLCRFVHFFRYFFYNCFLCTGYFYVYNPTMTINEEKYYNRTWFASFSKVCCLKVASSFSPRVVHIPSSRSFTVSMLARSLLMVVMVLRNSGFDWILLRLWWHTHIKRRLCHATVMW